MGKMELENILDSFAISRFNREKKRISYLIISDKDTEDEDLSDIYNEPRIDPRRGRSPFLPAVEIRS